MSFLNNLFKYKLKDLLRKNNKKKRNNKKENRTHWYQIGFEHKLRTCLSEFSFIYIPPVIWLSVFYCILNWVIVPESLLMCQLTKRFNYQFLYIVLMYMNTNCFFYYFFPLSDYFSFFTLFNQLIGEDEE